MWRIFGVKRDELKSESITSDLLTFYRIHFNSFLNLHCKYSTSGRSQDNSVSTRLDQTSPDQTGLNWNWFRLRSFFFSVAGCPIPVQRGILGKNLIVVALFFTSYLCTRTIGEHFQSSLCSQLHHHDNGMKTCAGTK